MVVSGYAEQATVASVTVESGYAEQVVGGSSPLGMRGVEGNLVDRFYNKWSDEADQVCMLNPKP